MWRSAAGECWARKHVEAAGSGTVPFYGRYQAGVTTAQQESLCFASFDVKTSDRNAVVQMLKDWTTASALMSAGNTAGTAAGHQYAPPDDTGEALGLTAGN